MRLRILFLPILLILVIAFGAFIGFVARAQEGVPVIPFDPQTAAAIAEPWAAEVARDHPWIVTALLVIGALRAVFKPLMALLRMRAAATPDPSDDARLSRWETSPIARLLTWSLDFVASIKVAPPARSTTASVVAGVDRGAASLLALGCVFLTACAVSGCASFTTTQIDRRNEQLGTTEIETRIAGRTLFTSKSQLANFKAAQTDKSQGASVGSLTQESSGTNAVRALEALDSILSKVR